MRTAIAFPDDEGLCPISDLPYAWCGCWACRPDVLDDLTDRQPQLDFDPFRED